MNKLKLVINKCKRISIQYSELSLDYRELARSLNQHKTSGKDLDKIEKHLKEKLNQFSKVE